MKLPSGSSLLSSAAVALALLVQAGPAQAADNAASADAAADAVTTADAAAPAEPQDDIVVTARRRQERAQDVPIALSTVGAEQLEKTGAFTLGQISQLVPSVNIVSSNPRNTNINIRGLGTNIRSANDGLESGVGVYIDNVYYGRLGQSQFDLIDLERVEVLRGPQGTLFGKNTTAGAINITTRAPSFDPEFFGEVSGGNYGYHQFRGSVSGPLADTIAARLSIADTHRDGYIRNTVTGGVGQSYDNFTARGQLLFRPTDALDIKIIADYGQQKGSCCVWVEAAVFTTYDSGAAIANNYYDRLARLGYEQTPVEPFARRAAWDSPYAVDMKSYGTSGQVDWRLDGATITSITAYRWWDWDPQNDADYSELDVFRMAQVQNRQRQFSQEIRLASEGTRTIDYVLGAYYFWQRVRSDSTIIYGAEAAGFNLPATVPALIGNAALDGLGTNSVSDPSAKSHAAFGQLTWNVSERLKLTAGLRYTHEDKEGSFESVRISAADLSGLTPAEAATATALRNQFSALNAYSVSFSDSSASGLITASYAPSRDLLLYGTYAHGGKSGGLNLAARLPAGITPQVDPETVDSFEIGLKSQWFDRALTVNLAAFETNISDYQSVVFDQPPGQLTATQYIGSIPKVRSRGLEADLAWRASEWVSLTASGTFLDATYRRYENAPQKPEDADQGGSQDLSGERLAGSSKFSYSLGADVAQPIDAAGSLAVYAHADYSYRSSFFTEITNSRFSAVDGYGLLNARIGVRSEDGRWDLSAWARNLADKDYFQTFTVANTGRVVAIIGEPRTYGLTLRSRF